MQLIEELQKHETDADFRVEFGASLFLIVATMSILWQAIINVNRLWENIACILLVGAILLFIKERGSVLSKAGRIYERCANAFNGKYSLSKNKVVWVVVFVFVFGVVPYVYNKSSQAYLLTRDNWQLVPDVILKSDCRVVVDKSTKHTVTYYAFECENEDVYRWNEEVHMLCFKEGYPEVMYLKGDTLSLWIEPGTHHVYDVEKNGEKSLDLARRNKKAEVSTERGLKGVAIFWLIISFVWLFTSHKKVQAFIFERPDEAVAVEEEEE
ncbi:hypothetical protein FLA_3871 [Filimonas lacunae]|nr:hypothetical protein FLA_3871 [Filimonas lacunae]